MIRLVAFVAAIAFTATSANAQEIHVSLVGKSQEQIQADVKIAARTVCARETGDQLLVARAYQDCVRATFRAAMAQLPA